MAHVRVLVHAPVGLVQIVVYGLGNVEIRGGLLADLAALLAVYDVTLGRIKEPGFHENLFDSVLDELLLWYVDGCELFLDLKRKSFGQDRVLDPRDLQRFQDCMRYAIR